ncbi:porin family protein [uncultured Roseivirga sp.]|uniref:porin family protein n=1 Tax=uncultured Roseivirga sp. TaxID=543088 RepID=UPI0030DB0341|tara:strand:- start:299 stop:946 length:648 start_codon:yes stop_codon:yes gene_type:complete
MRKFTFAAVLLSLFSISALAQDYNIGIKLGPTLTYSKPSTEGTSTNYDDDGSSVQFLIGAFVDYQFQENYFFSAGINYASKDFGITARSTNSIANITGAASFSQEFLQIPALLKLYTNEVILDTKVYFNFGLVPEIRLSNSPKSDNSDLIREFRSFDLAGNFGGGLERTIGVNTRVYAGLFYNLGFINQVKTQNDSYDELTLKNRLFALEIGIKF